MSEEIRIEYGDAGYDIIIDDTEEQLKEAASFLRDQVENAIGTSITKIRNDIKNDQAELDKKIKDQQMERNRSVILEILDTMEKFKTKIGVKFAQWRSDDEYR